MRTSPEQPLSLVRVALVSALLLSACAGSSSPGRATPAQAAPAPASSLRTPAVPPPSDQALLEDERNTIAVFEAASKATVYITQTSLVRDYWSRRTVEVPRGTGSGFIWDEDGHIVTNAHVVSNQRGGVASRYQVTLSDGRSFDAQLRGFDAYKDLAVLRLVEPPADLTPVRLAPKGWTPQVGQKTLAIGNPFGLDNTLTTGIISALNRDVEGFGGVTIRDMIQTDASINPGNSGGPLLDSQGRLIGVNTMIYSNSGSSAGIGFAVPIPAVRRTVPHLIETGKPLRLGMGVRLADPRQLARSGVRVDGVVIREVLSDTPAEKAGLRGLSIGPRGLRLGDVIVAADDQRVRDFDDLYTVLDGHEPGDEVRLKVQRPTGEVEIPVGIILVE